MHRTKPYNVKVGTLKSGRPDLKNMRKHFMNTKGIAGHGSAGFNEHFSPSDPKYKRREPYLKKGDKKAQKERHKQRAQEARKRERDSLLSQTRGDHLVWKRAKIQKALVSKNQNPCPFRKRGARGEVLGRWRSPGNWFLLVAYRKEWETLDFTTAINRVKPTMFQPFDDIFGNGMSLTFATSFKPATRTRRSFDLPLANSFKRKQKRRACAELLSRVMDLADVPTPTGATFLKQSAVNYLPHASGYAYTWDGDGKAWRKSTSSFYDAWNPGKPERTQFDREPCLEPYIKLDVNDTEPLGLQSLIASLGPELRQHRVQTRQLNELWRIMW